LTDSSWKNYSSEKLSDKILSGEKSLGTANYPGEKLSGEELSGKGFSK
jgi:hypothetical protein